MVGGIVTALTRKYTKRGDLMATFVLEDLGAALEVMVFPRTMADHGHVLEDDAIVCVKGRLDLRDDQAKIIAMEITRPELVLDGGTAGSHPGQARRSLNEARVAQLKEILVAHPGDSPVFVHLESAREDHGAAPRRRALRRREQRPLRRAADPPRRRLHRVGARTGRPPGACHALTRA